MPTLRTRSNAQSSSGCRKSAGSTTVQGRRLTRSAIALQPRVTEQPEFDSSTPLPSDGRHPSFPSPSPPPSLSPSPPSPDPTVTVQNALAISYPNLAKKSTGLRATRRQFVKRSQYTMAEDLAMLNYLLAHNLIDKVNLRSTWRELKRQHVTSHSAESMRVRVLRCLVHQLSSLLPDTEAEKIEFLRSCLLIPSQRDHNQLHPTGQPITLVAPSRSTRLRNFRSPAAAEVASADASPRTPPRSTAPATADPVSSLSQSRVSDSIVEENAFESGGPSAHQCSTPSKAPPKQSPPLFTRAPTEPIVEDHRNLRLSEPPAQVTRLTADSSQEPACLLPNFCEKPEVTAASPPPSLSAIVSSTAFAVRAVDDICRRYPFLESSDVLQLLFMTGGSLSAVESLLRGLTPHSSSSSSVSQPNDGDGGSGGGGLSNGEAPAATEDQPPVLWLPEDDCSLRSTDKAKVAEVVDKFGLQAVLSRLSYLTGRGLCKRAGC